MKAKQVLSMSLSLALTASLTAPAALAAQEEHGYTVSGEPAETITVDTADLIPQTLDPDLLEVMPIPVKTEDIALIAPAPDGEEEGSAYERFVDQYVAEYTTAHPDEYAAFDENAWFDKEWEGWTREEYLETFGLTPEGLKDAMWHEYVQELANPVWDEQKVAEYRAAHPGELESLNVSELLSRQGYADPITQYMKDHNYTTEDEVLENLYMVYVNERAYAAEIHQTAEDCRAKYPDLWAAFDQEAWFAEHHPDHTEERYMWEAGLWTRDELADLLFVEYMGEKTESQEQNWVWMPDLSLSVNGTTMHGSAIYAENGVSYLPAEELNAILNASYTKDTPVRDAAVAAGWDVTWNAASNQVVLLNKAEITKDWDFTNFDAMMNRLMATVKAEEGKPVHTKETADITLTRFNTLDGDETCTLRVVTDTVWKDNVINLTLSADLSQLLQMVPKATLNQMEVEMPKLTFQNLKTLLTGCKVRVILNLDSGMIYCNAPILSLWSDDMTENTWFAVDMGEVLSGQSDAMTDLLAGKWNTADYLYDALLSSSANMPFGAELGFTSARSTETMLNVILGNDAVVEKDGAYTWKADTATLDKMMKAAMIDMLEALGGEELADEDLAALDQAIPSMSDFFKEYDLAITVDGDGKFTANVVLRLNMDSLADLAGDSVMGLAADDGSLGIIGGADGPTGLLVNGVLGGAMNALDFRLAAESAGTAEHATGTSELHVKNQFKMVIQEVSDRVENAADPMAEPPAGAKLMEF